MLPSFPRARFLSFLKADYCPPIQAFQKAKERKHQDWNVTSCNFHLLVKNNLIGWVVVFLSNVCWTHANRKLSLQQSCSEKLRRYCCKSLFFQWEKLFAKDIYITIVHFKSIIEPYKCQIFWGFTPNPIGSLQTRAPNSLLQSSEIPNLRLTTHFEISGSNPARSKIVWFPHFDTSKTCQWNFYRCKSNRTFKNNFWQSFYKLENVTSRIRRRNG